MSYKYVYVIIPCVEHGRVSFEINDREQSFGTSSLQISAINEAFRTFSDKISLMEIIFFG